MKSKIFNLVLIASSFLSVVCLQRALVFEDHGFDPSNNQTNSEGVRLKAQLRSLENFLDTPFDNLLGDFTYLHSVQYFGGFDSEYDFYYDAIPYFFTVVVKKHPRLLHAHQVLAPANSLFAGYPEITVELLEKALQFMTPEAFSEAFSLWWFKGGDEMLFLGKMEDARQSYLTASEWALRSDYPSNEFLAQRTAETAEFLASEPNSTQAQIAGWYSIMNFAPSPRVRAKAVRRIENLGGEVRFYPGGSITAKLPDR